MRIPIMSGYIPPHLRKAQTVSSAPSASSAPSGSLRQSSLRQGTMASLTRSTEPHHRVALPRSDDFPSLGSSGSSGGSGSSGSSGSSGGSGSSGSSSDPQLLTKNQQSQQKNVWSQPSSQRFVDLARSWGVQQKEEEEERKRLAKERLTIEQQEREHEKKERAYFRIVDPTKILYRTHVETVYDIGGDQDELIPETYEEESEQEEQEQVAEDVSYRRSKHDLY